jgi:penicillin-binding protein 1A
MVQITTSTETDWYTTIDSDAIAMEEAVAAHMANLQEEFSFRLKNNKNAPL